MVIIFKNGFSMHLMLKYVLTKAAKNKNLKTSCNC